MKERHTKFSVQKTFSQLRTHFGAELKQSTTQIRFAKDVRAFVEKVNSANAATANGSLVFK